MHMDQIIPIEKRNDTLIIDICTANYVEFINKIMSCEKIISSSLHGIILAETYGVQAILLKPTKDYLKYDDWYYSTLRYDYPTVNSIEEGMRTPPIALPTNLNKLREEQIKAFPYDLYE